MKYLISYILAACMLFGVSACKNTTPESGQGEGTVVLCDFESRDEVRKLTFVNYFGKNSINDDMRYVRSGSHSIKLQPMGWGSGNPENGKPGIDANLQWLNGETDDFTDFSRVEYVLFDMYNDTAAVETVSVALIDENSQRTVDTVFQLSPKAWTRVAYRINPELALTFDLSNIKTVELLFEPCRFDETAPVLYMDRFALRYAENEHPPVDIELDEGELCSFDKDYQAYAVSTSIMGGGGSREWVPRVAINTDARFSKNGEGNSLEVYMPHGHTPDASWPFFLLSERLMTAVDFTQYGMDDEIVFDIYNPNKRGFSIGAYVGYSQAVSAVQSFECSPGKWTETRIRIGNIAGVVEVGKDPDTGEPVYGTDTSALVGMNYFMFVWGEFPGTSAADDRIMYLDDIRIERAK